MSDKTEENKVVPINTFCNIYTTKQSGCRYDVYLNNNISEPFNYHELLETLRKAEEGEEVYIHINNCGGYIHTAMQIINAIKSSDATITTSLEGAGHSAASLILLSGDYIRVKEYGTMCCHFYSGGIVGKGNEIESQSAFDIKYYKDFFRKIYKEFLTVKEIERLIKGEDFWFSSEEILKRLKK